MTARPKSARIETGTPIATQKAINLALQGGGSHSAFTWGVLDRLLEDERLTFDGITATSAGSVNAVPLADGLALGGRKAARELLRVFWEKMSDMICSSIMAPSFLDKMDPGFGLERSPGFLIVGSQRNVSCMFRGTSGEPDEPYTGTMTRVGLDVGLTTGSVIIWAVFADTNRYKGMLTGTYTGASAEMSIAAGLGANVLVGGSNRTMALQPLSVQGQIGLDIAAGVGSLDLHPSW